MDDDFLSQYEDELEVLQEMDFDPVLPNKGKKRLNFSSPNTSEVKKVMEPGATVNESLTLQCLDTTSDDGGDSYESKFRHLSYEKDTILDNKRKLHQVSDALSDDEGDLVIDAELSDVVPLPKRPRRGVTPAKQSCDDDDDFVITPPPPPSSKSTQVELGVNNTATSNQQQQQQAVKIKFNLQEDRLTASYDFERERVLKKIPNGAYFYVTNEEGKRVYMQLRSMDAIKQCSAQLVEQNSLNLLGTPLEVLKREADNERSKKLIGEAEGLSRIVNRALHGSSEDDGQDNNVICEDDTQTDEAVLWVERYKPKRYIELLSDETTNRTLLKWLKLWDYVVFGKTKKEKQKQVKEIKKQEQNKFWNMFQLSEELDHLNRPIHKVALLAGPPGLGKTTMAHVIAQHGGYNIVEMNASDERSADIFKQRIEAATQMKAVLGADPRPNCLIIDEIDGAPQPAINMLLSILKRGEKDSTSTSRKRRRDNSPLLRPIICICNDLYTPALRQLKQQALVIVIPQTASTTLASRLLEISRREKIRTDLTTLLALCEKADNDIRSCLNTLQFIKSKTSQLSLKEVHSTSLGQKDCHKSLFTVWQHIFTMPKPKRKQYINPHDRRANQNTVEDLALAMAANNMTLSARFHNILQMALAAGDYQKVLQGLHENYLESKVKDHTMMESIMMATEWMQFVDMLDVKVNHHQDYSLMRYMPYLSVLFHLLFATNHPQKIVYPHAQYEMTTKATRNEALVTSMISEMAPPVRKHLNLLITVTEVLPPLLSIIQPTLRPVNTQLYSAREKKELAQLVQVMISYNLTYHQERSPEGQYNYVLDPNLDDVVRFGGLKAGRQLTYAARQLIAREIELEKMRRSEAALGTRQRNGPPLSDQSRAPEVKKASIPRQILQPKVVTEDLPAKDFFGRKVTLPTTPQPGKGSKYTPEVVGGDIWFKFKEGYTNAVRKTVRLKDLI